MFFYLTKRLRWPYAPLTASDPKVYGRISLICFLFREQLDRNSELQKENEQFVSLLLTLIVIILLFGCGPHEIPQSF